MECKDCGARLFPRKGSDHGYCQRCVDLHKCIVCGCLTYEDEEQRICADCRSVLDQIAAAHAEVEERRYFDDTAREAKIEEMKDRARQGLPLFP